MNEINRLETHSFSSEMREGIEISGVRDVLSFDDRSVILETSCGNMAVEGEGLHITVLNIKDGEVAVKGKLDGVYYYESKPRHKRGIFGKIND